MKILIVLALIGVLVALASAGLFMLRKGGDTRSRDSRMAKALAVRVGVSVALFLFILFSWYMGWVQPTGLPSGR